MLYHCTIVTTLVWVSAFTMHYKQDYITLYIIRIIDTYLQIPMTLHCVSKLREKSIVFNIYSKSFPVGKNYIISLLLLVSLITQYILQIYWFTNNKEGKLKIICSMRIIFSYVSKYTLLTSVPDNNQKVYILTDYVSCSVVEKNSDRKST